MICGAPGFCAHSRLAEAMALTKLKTKSVPGLEALTPLAFDIVRGRLAKTM